MRCFVALVGLVAVVSAARVGPVADDLDAGKVGGVQPLGELFDQWIAKHGKSYAETTNGLGASEEYSKRLAIFTRNWHFVARMAEMKVNETWVLGNDGPFMDKTHEEFSELLGFKQELVEARQNALPDQEKTAFKYQDSAIVEAVDWREKGAVTEVKNQGQCGSCWAFSTTGSIEGINFLNSGSLVSLSEQDLVSCDPQDHGCGGGIMENAYHFIEKMGGIVTEQEYPYTAHMGVARSCNPTKEGASEKVQITGFEEVPKGSEEALQKALSYQPVSVAVNAKMWQFYHGGVYNGIYGICNGAQLDHGVLAVGMDTKEGYYIVKNSWGPMWGERGYIRLKMNRSPTSGGLCGIANHASYPLQATNQ